MIHLVSDLMVLVRSESGQIQFEKKEVDLTSIGAQVFLRFKEKALSKNIHYDFSHGDAHYDFVSGSGLKGISGIPGINQFTD